MFRAYILQPQQLAGALRRRRIRSNMEATASLPDPKVPSPSDPFLRALLTAYRFLYNTRLKELENYLRQTLDHHSLSRTFKRQLQTPQIFQTALVLRQEYVASTMMFESYHQLSPRNRPLQLVLLSPEGKKQKVMAWSQRTPVLRK